MSYVVIKLSGAHTPLYGKLKFARHVEQLKKPFFLPLSAHNFICANRQSAHLSLAFQAHMLARL